MEDDITHKFVVARVDGNGRPILTDERKNTKEEAETEILRRLKLGVMGSETYTILEIWTTER